VIFWGWINLKLVLKLKRNTSKQIKGNAAKSEINIRKLKPVAGKSVSGGANLFDNKLVAGNIVMHERKGRSVKLRWSGD
jgi:DNA helicase-2/ATP-dependent DNA helicase PcrA